MISLPISCQQTLSARESDEQFDLERLEQLLPEAAHLAVRDPQAYALAYAERYQGDMLYLEPEWDFLAAAQLQAWQQAEYEVVVRLTAALAYPAGRRTELAEAEQVLQLGIEACRLSADQRHLAFFLNRQASLAIARGHYERGQQLWYSSLQLARSTGIWPVLWEPLASCVYSADILGNYGAARQFVEFTQHMQQDKDSESLAAAFFIQGFFARVINNLDDAHANFNACLQFLASLTPGIPSSPSHQLFSMIVQAELARVHGQYARAQTCTETALTLTQIYGDLYTLGTLLIDQAIFTHQHSQLADTRKALSRLQELALRMETPHFLERSRFFEQRLLESERTPPALPRLLDLPPTPTGLHNPLSARETEVLQLVAEGLPNREIAQRLVITPGTVKKHLEHIYTRLDTHNRTAAVARARTLQIIS